MTDREQRLDRLADEVRTYLGIDTAAVMIDYDDERLVMRPVDVMVLLASARKADVLMDDEEEDES
jgi:hypothetical protein